MQLMDNRVRELPQQYAHDAGLIRVIPGTGKLTQMEAMVCSCQIAATRHERPTAFEHHCPAGINPELKDIGRDRAGAGWRRLFG
jgi:hypothetical protein